VKKIFPALLSFFFIISPLHSGILPDNAFSKDARGTTSASFLKNVSSARFFGLGQTGSELAAPDNLFYNPAAMGLYGHSSGLLMNYQALLEGSYRTDLGYLWKEGSCHYGFGLIYNSYGAFDRMDARGTVSGSFAPYDYALFSGISFEKNGISYGANLKFISEDLVYESASSAALDLGLLIRGNKKDKKEYSLLVRNLGLPMKLGGESSPLPLEVTGGLRYPYSNLLDLLFEIKFPCDDEPYLAAGGEFVLPLDIFDFTLRSGFNFKNREEMGFMGVFSAGFGLNFSGKSLDYAYVPYGELGETHRLSFNYMFGEYREKEKEEKVSEAAQALFLKNKKFAVMDFEASGVSENYGSFMANNVEKELAENGYALISRGDFAFIKAAAEVPPPYDEAAAAALCRGVKADYCVYGAVGRRKEGVAFMVKVYDLNADRTVKSFTVMAADEYKFNPVSEKIAEEITKAE